MELFISFAEFRFLSNLISVYKRFPTLSDETLLYLKEIVEQKLKNKLLIFQDTNLLSILIETLFEFNTDDFNLN